MTLQSARGVFATCTALLVLAAGCTSDTSRIEVVVTSPSEDAFINAEATIQVDVRGGAPSEVVLRVDDDELASISAPYSYVWDTTSTAEGSYGVTAHAVIGGRAYVSERRVITVDRTPPTITVRTPTPGATDVARREPFVAVFSEPLEPSSVTDSSVIVTGSSGEAIEVDVSLSGDGYAVRIVAHDVAVPDTLDVAFASTVTDRAGNPLDPSSAPWTFIVPDWLPLGEGLTGSRRPAIAIDADGRIVVARPVYDGSTHHLRVDRWNGQAWEPLGGTISANPGATSAWSPSIAITPDGDPIVAWHESDGTTTNVYVRQWVGTGSGWVPFGEGLSSRPGSSDALDPSLAVDDIGRPVVAWSDSAGGYRIIVYRWMGGAWEALGEPLIDAPSPNSGLHARYPSLSLDGSGFPVVAWYETDGGMSTYNVTPVWRWTVFGWEPLGDPPQSHGYALVGPSLVLTGDDAPIVAGREYDSDSSAYELRVQQWADGTWEYLGDPLNSDALAGSLSVAWHEESGTVAAWHGRVSDVNEVHVAQFDGSDWNPIGGTLSFVPDTPGAVSPDVTIDPSGVPVVAWRESDRVYVARANR